LQEISNGGASINPFEVILEAIGDGKVVETLTLIAGPVEYEKAFGKMLVIISPEQVEGEMVDTDFTAIVLSERYQQEWSKPSILTISYQEREYQVFWNRVGNEKRQALILGGGHISQPLVQILAILEYEVTIVDDRLEFANPERFPGARQVICKPFGQVLEHIELDNQAVIIIVTRGHQYDLDCLRSVIGKEAGYIGMIGSRRKVQGTLKVLREEGIDRNLLGRVRAPIGLDLGGQSPSEIAVSIVAEMIAVGKGGSCMPLYLMKDGNHG